MDKRIASIRNLTFLIICGLSLLTSCSKDEDVNWSGSHLRQWLNSGFLHRAFSETERNAIETTSVENAPNVSYGTNCGPDTQDRVFIFSNKEVFASPLATDYGFYAGSGIDDAARRFRSTPSQST